MKRLLVWGTFLFFLVASNSAFTFEHPSIFINAEEANLIQENSDKYSLFQDVVRRSQQAMGQIIREPVEVPPPGEAGGYAHERHKQNYRDMKDAGLLYQITGNEKYAKFIVRMLDEYAKMYPELGPHPLAHNQAPGKLFHQMLNETVWLVNTSIAYDCIYNWLPEEKRSLYEQNIFRPMAEWFTGENAHEFDRIHNHGTWSVASVGMIGYVMEDQELVDMALYGTDKSGKGGFLRQLDLLFSPDGYYMEGPYYIRYALRPFFYFAEAVERNQPDLEIYEYRDQILRKAIYATLQTAFPNGVLPPINDASRTMDVKAPGIVLATDLAYTRYKEDARLLGVVNFQNDVVLNQSGLAVAKGLAALDSEPRMEWNSVEFTDGPEGDQGGLGILRTGKGKDQSVLLMKYGVHGGGHGHFDKLHYIFYNQRREVVNDYGFARWINIEPKFGGRYLDENDSYAEQTIAHNTVVVDQTSQNEYERDEAEEVSGHRHFFDASDKDAQFMSATANDYYPGVEMQRTMVMLQDEAFDYPVIIDLYRLQSDEQHEYDFPIHYRGQLINFNLDYSAHTEKWLPLGGEFGYQHLWNVAEGTTDSSIAMTWLDGNRYYTFHMAGSPESEIIFSRIGATDPNFNLRSEPMFLVRRTTSSHLFASVIEPHGYFNEATESSVQARPAIEKVTVLGHSEEGSVVEVLSKNGKKWIVMVTNQQTPLAGEHSVEFGERQFVWNGAYKVISE
ncbi:MAG: heparinase II/III family protein [Candidatus Marinimicrobia bacterium]|nr:heparinase II/III family protein [Candidatus Neomarinimicrobiota bacterium]MCF7828927.1 heparinase II/III family protein [Candidatus Neomarinimicrobiota bacterium]MCF7879887.1 heparinase II/III family protein [Candidatus Neomarinimicrobiota bacterium]